MKPRTVYALVGLVVAAAALVALPARATYGARTTADEPQYLLSALSLAEDGDLWLDDELAGREYEPFHEVTLPVQTEVLDNGHAVSPHDPLLPALLAGPMGLGGWVGAKAALAAVAGVLAGLLTWLAHRRIAVPLGAAAVTVLAFGLTAPVSAYATQVYPELPAALAVTVALAALTTHRSATWVAAGDSAPAGAGSVPVGPGSGLAGAGSVGLWVAAVVSLPWLGVKYVPVAAALAAVGLVALWRAERRQAALGVLAGLGLAGLAYLVVHRLLYGGWTVYAAGDHFVGGELTVMGNDPNYSGRSRRVVGLLLDRSFGLAAWMPGYLLVVPALASLLRRRPPGWAALTLPLAAGWATATWVALTMHGWWWPGRQTVVVVPCLILAIAWWVGRASGRLAVVVGAGVLGAFSWWWLVVEVLQRRRTLIVDFDTTTNPWFRAWRSVLPDYRDPGLDDWLLQAGWLAVLGILAVVALTEPRLRALPFRVTRRRRPTHVPA